LISGWFNAVEIACLTLHASGKTAKRVLIALGGAEMADSFDYVIVGAGSAGCVLANRLSANPNVTVCLIEAGGEANSILNRVPVGAAVFIPGRPKISNWAFETVPQAGLNGRRGYQPRGKTLGGSSAINAMLYVRGQREDYDGWAASGATGWGYDDILPYFKKAERNQNGADILHGGDGPLQVCDPASPRPVSKAFIEAAGQTQIALNDDFNGTSQEGAGLFQVNQYFDGPHKGERCHTAAAYLEPVRSRPNLHVETRATALRIIIENKRATSIVIAQNGAEKTVSATREVILSAGAFGSPQLLMLSGIGPAAHLQSKAIAVVHDLPGVGENLQDHIDFIRMFKSPNKDMFGLSPGAPWQIFKAALEWRKHGTGLLTSTFAEACAFYRSSPDVASPDVQIHFIVGLVDDHLRKIQFGHGWSAHACVLRPYSKGTVRLASNDPYAAPEIDPKFFSDQRDMQTLLKGLKKLDAILKAPALAPYRGKEIYLRGDENDAELETHIRARADTIYHPVGTCKMGVDAMAVVGPDLRVHGIEGLRVIDASVMPNITSGNTNAPTIMIAEKGAEMVMG
jgi:choline dehydrogenase-like flavoprotein